MTNFLASPFMHNIFSGLAQGVLYSLLALSLVIIWQSTHVLNFAQGAMAMFATYIGMTEMDRGVGYWWCVIISVLVGMIFGGLAERVLIRPLYGKPEINPIVVMVGFLGVIEAVAAAIWTSTTRNIASPFSQIYFHANGQVILLSPFVIFQIVLAIVIMLGIAALFRFTKLGLQLRASALAPEVARLLGVRVSRMLTIGWMLSAGVGAVAAVPSASSPPIWTASSSPASSPPPSEVSSPPSARSPGGCSSDWPNSSSSRTGRRPWPRSAASSSWCSLS